VVGIIITGGSMKFKTELTRDDIQRMIKAAILKKKRKKLKTTYETKDETHDEREHEIYIRCLLLTINVTYGEREYLGKINMTEVDKVIKSTKRVIT